MTTARQGRFRSRRTGRGSRPKTRWENLFFTQAHGVALSRVFTDLTPEPIISSNVASGTAKIVRFLAHFDYKSNGTIVAPGEVFTISVGVGVVTIDAVTAGAIPDPETDFTQGWYYWTGRSPLLTSEHPMVSWDTDIRTARVLRGGYRLVIVSETLLQELASDLTVSIRDLWVVDA